ncbi:hypothetical protein QYE76_042381 [Lolium multiflorum]|uniref:Transposase (putative) gypsy type domain-containing protein n=1 Tax=Lolium multiflorum TaxID=4521 RepID=A0AAD8TH35_LOLMU|nr:hypothetical protein QYE76_042381 [Lolium multiflorum]
MATEDLEWERSKISNQDMNLLKRLGFTKKKDALRFPHEESYPSPPMEYRLHQLTPNSILHVSIFITLCECFLGVQPNWALWKRIFCLRRNGSHGVAYNIGGVVICVRSDVDYFDVKFPDSVQGWRKRWLYVHEESSDSMEYNIAPFDGKIKILRRRSWDAKATEEEKLATEALMTRIRELQSTRGKELSGIQITAYFLRIRMQPLQARKNPLWMYAGDEDVERLSTDLSAKDLEKLIRRISKLSKKDTVPSSCKVRPFCSANPLPEELIRFGTQFIGYRDYAGKLEGRTHQEYELENPEDDELLDALSLLEIHGTEARNGLAEAEAGLSRLFPYFFKKKEEPAVFIDLAKCFTGKEDLGLQLRQEGLKLIFDNYTSTPGPSEVFPPSRSKKTPVAVEFIEDSSSKDSTQDLEELRQQLQSTKKQSLMLMEQSRKSSEREKVALQQAQDAIIEKDAAVAEAAAATSRENFMLQLLTDASLDMADARYSSCLDGQILGCSSIHGFVRAQLAAGARFAMIMIKICYPKLDVGQIVPKCLAKMAKRRKNFSKYDDVVTPVAEDMMDELLRMDSEFFVKGSYAEHSTRAINNERLTIDNILGNP